MKNLFVLPAVLAIATVVICGCASLSEQQCLEGNWESVGVTDGARGESSEYRLSAHRRACENAGVTPNRQSYLVGWNKGVKSYCTPQNAFEVGARGAIPNEGICPQGTGQTFTANYRLGFQVYQLQSEIYRLQSEIRDLERKLDDKNLSHEQRRDVRGKIMNREDALSQVRPLLFAAQSRPLIQY